MGTSLVVRTQAKILSVDRGGHQLNCSACFYSELNYKVEAIIEKAVNRAKRNGRTTVMGKDV